MKHAGEGKILAVLRWRRRYCALLAGLVLLVLLLGLKLLLLVIGRDALQRAQHEERRLWWQVSSESVQSSAPQHKHMQIPFNKLVTTVILLLPRSVPHALLYSSLAVQKMRNSLLDSTPNHGAAYNIGVSNQRPSETTLTHPSWLGAKQHISTRAPPPR